MLRQVRGAILRGDTQTAGYAAARHALLGMSRPERRQPGATRRAIDAADRLIDHALTACGDAGPIVDAVREDARTARLTARQAITRGNIAP